MTYRRRRALGFLALALASSIGATGGSAQSDAVAGQRDTGQPVGWYPVVGVVWLRPTDAALREIYRGGPGFSLGMGYSISRRWQIELAMERARRSSALSTPPFARNAEGRLTMTPIILDVRWSPTQGKTRPFLRLGGGMLFADERVEYRLADITRTSDGTRTDGVALFGAGVEAIRGKWRYRLTGAGMLGPARREILRPNGRTEEASGSVRTTVWSLGLSAAYL